MHAGATLAMIPKARGMFAKRMSAAEYEEMMRRRTVPELAAMLKRHPYFGGNLATLSTVEPHRGQIEELLNMDVFSKYEALEQYDFSDNAFMRYYLDECEMREVLKALHLISIGLRGVYLKQVPAYLVGKTRLDLFALGQAASFAEVVELLRGTHYYRPLRGRLLADPQLKDYAMTEAAVLRSAYAEWFALAERALTGADRKAAEALFLQQAEIYNLELVMRVKAFFPKVYSPDELRMLMLPYRYHLKPTTVDMMVNAKDAGELEGIYARSNAVKYSGGANLDELAGASGRHMYQYAKRMLHLTASPVAALVAFITLAKLERENIVNVVEGVRYGLEPGRIRAMLWF